MNKIIYTAILCICIVAISFYDFKMHELPQPEHALYYPEGKEIKGFNLTDHHGKSFSKDQLMNKWSLVFLGYTSCPHICSPTLQNLHFIYKDLKRVAHNSEVLLISVDPKRDSQAVLSQFISYFNPNFKALRAEHDVLFPLVRNLGLSYAFTEPEAEEVAERSSEQTLAKTNAFYWVDHSASLILLNPEGKISAVFKPEKRSDQSMNNKKLLSDYQKIINLYKYEHG
jgi:protein SCO1